MANKPIGWGRSHEVWLKNKGLNIDLYLHPKLMTAKQFRDFYEAGGTKEQMQELVDKEIEAITKPEATQPMVDEDIKQAIIEITDRLNTLEQNYVALQQSYNDLEDRVISQSRLKAFETCLWFVYDSMADWTDKMQGLYNLSGITVEPIPKLTYQEFIQNIKRLSGEDKNEKHTIQIQR